MIWSRVTRRERRSPALGGDIWTYMLFLKTDSSDLSVPVRRDRSAVVLRPEQAHVLTGSRLSDTVLPRTFSSLSSTLLCFMFFITKCIFHLFTTRWLLSTRLWAPCKQSPLFYSALYPSILTRTCSRRINEKIFIEWIYIWATNCGLSPELCIWSVQLPDSV